MNLHSIARDGVVSTADLRSLGLGPDDVRSLVRAGSVRRLVRGMYAVRDPQTGTAPWEGETAYRIKERLHVLKTRALVRSFEGRVVASHQSALLLHGAPLWRADLDLVHLTRATTTHSRHRPGAVVHPCVALPGAMASGVATVGLATAVVQVGMVAQVDGVDPLHSLIAADWALHHERVTREDLDAALAQLARCTGITRVRAILEHANGLHESVGETRTAVVLRGLGYRFRAQVRSTVPGLGATRTDFELDGEPVVIEFDGLGKYGAVPGEPSAQPTPRTYQRAFWAEKRREDRYREHGYVFARIGWEDLDRPWVVREKVETARRSLHRSGAS